MFNDGLLFFTLLLHADKTNAGTLPTWDAAVRLAMKHLFI